jgi:Beta-galactosidase jelly roll domain
MRCFWLFWLSSCLWAQHFNLQPFTDGPTSLAGNWKFHAGDDSQWADPQFNDSSWRSVKVPRSLPEQGYPEFSGYGWYRAEVKVQGAPDLMLLLGSVDVAEVFANGTKVGFFGSFPPHARTYTPQKVSFDIPHSPLSRDGRLVLAIRIWADPRSLPGTRAVSQAVLH